MPPAFLDGFSSNHSSVSKMSTLETLEGKYLLMMSLKATLGSDMGIVPGTNISAGAKLKRGSWNARPYGPLYDLQVEGVQSRTDLYFNKSMFTRHSTLFQSLNLGVN